MKAKLQQPWGMASLRSRQAPRKHKPVQPVGDASLRANAADQACEHGHMSCSQCEQATARASEWVATMTPRATNWGAEHDSHYQWPAGTEAKMREHVSRALEADLQPISLADQLDAANRAALPEFEAGMERYDGAKLFDAPAPGSWSNVCPPKALTVDALGAAYEAMKRIRDQPGGFAYKPAPPSPALAAIHAQADEHVASIMRYQAEHGPCDLVPTGKEYEYRLVPRGGGETLGKGEPQQPLQSCVPITETCQESRHKDSTSPVESVIFEGRPLRVGDRLKWHDGLGDAHYATLRRIGPMAGYPLSFEVADDGQTDGDWFRPDDFQFTGHPFTRA